MDKNKKNLLLLLLLIVVAVLVWYVVVKLYEPVKDLPDVDVESPVVDEPIKVNNVLETTVSVVPPDENGGPTAE